MNFQVKTLETFNPFESLNHVGGKIKCNHRKIK